MDDDEKIETKDVKVIILGENGVGKTSIINRYVNDEFNPNNVSETLGSTFSMKEIKKLNIIYKLKIWDSTGQEKYHFSFSFLEYILNIKYFFISFILIIIIIIINIISF